MTAALAVMPGVGGPKPLAASWAPSVINHSDTTTSQNDNASLLATGGIPPYTYSTTGVLGGAGIVLSNATTNNPTWSVTGMTPVGTMRSGDYTGVVTDSIGKTAQADISISFQRV